MPSIFSHFGAGPPPIFPPMRNRKGSPQVEQNKRRRQNRASPTRTRNPEPVWSGHSCPLPLNLPMCSASTLDGWPGLSTLFFSSRSETVGDVSRNHKAGPLPRATIFPAIIVPSFFVSPEGCSSPVCPRFSTHEWASPPVERRKIRHAPLRLHEKRALRLLAETSFFAPHRLRFLVSGVHTPG